MKKSFKRAVAAVSAVSVIAFGGLSASAATKEDVIAAARSAGFLEVYVQQLSNFLASNNFSSDQYDIMIGASEILKATEMKSRFNISVKLLMK